MEGQASPAVADVVDLLDQCSPEELSDILKALEGGGLGSLQSPKSGPQPPTPAPTPVTPAPPQAPAMQPRSPAPPARPPPTGGSGRRPAPAVLKKAEGTGAAAPGAGAARTSAVPETQVTVADVMKAVEARVGAAGTAAAPAPAPQVTAADVMRAVEAHSSAAAQASTAVEAQVTMADIKRALVEHSASIAAEVQKALPALPAQEGSLDLATLTKTLSERDSEVRALEETLSGLQAELSSKDRRVAELGGELDRTVREVRHKQLDLEFQQLKLEERVRCNAELEQSQRRLTSRMEEASLSARHAALDVEMCMATPRTLRAQGSLPWTVRKNRLPSVGGGMTPR